MDFTLNVYESDGVTVKKVCNCAAYDLMFGTVRRLMGLLKIDQVDDQVEILKTVYDAWDELTSVLTVVFPDMTAEDWDHVKIKELLPIMIGIAKYSVSEIMKIPISPN